jgi:hypothetical protein
MSGGEKGSNTRPDWVPFSSKKVAMEHLQTVDPNLVFVRSGQSDVILLPEDVKQASATALKTKGTVMKMSQFIEMLHKRPLLPPPTTTRKTSISRAFKDMHLTHAPSVQFSATLLGPTADAPTKKKPSLLKTRRRRSRTPIRVQLCAQEADFGRSFGSTQMQVRKKITQSAESVRIKHVRTGGKSDFVLFPDSVNDFPMQLDATFGTPLRISDFFKQILFL